MGCSGHLGCFHFLAVGNNATVNMECIYLLNSDFISFGYIPRSGIARSYGSSIFNFSKNLHTVFHNGCANLLSHHHCMRIPFIPHSRQLLLSLLFDHNYSNKCEVIPHCSFDLQFPDDCWAHFHILVGHLYVFGKCLFRSSAQFWIRLFTYLLLSCMSSSYILDIKPL